MDSSYLLCLLFVSSLPPRTLSSLQAELKKIFFFLSLFCYILGAYNNAWQRAGQVLNKEFLHG